MKTMQNGWQVCLIGLACLVVVACSSGDEEAKQAAAAAQARSSAAAAKAKAAVQDQRVKAVRTSAGAPLIELRFELSARPELNKPLEMQIYLLGLEATSGLQLSFKTNPKLELVSGAQANFAALSAGGTLTHTLTLRGHDNGLFTVDVRLVAESDKQSHTMTYAIPVAFGAAATP